MEGKILEANDLFYKVTGFSEDKIVGNSYSILIPEDERNKPQNAVMWESILMGQSFTGEFQFVDAAGKRLWLSGTYNPVFNLTGKAERILMLGQFVTQDKEKVQELQETITALKSCFPMVEVNDNLALKSANDLFLTELGMKRLELKKVLLGDILSTTSSAEIQGVFIQQSTKLQHT